MSNSPQDILASFQFNQLAEVEAGQQYILACLFASSTFEEFRDKVREGISTVELDPGMSSDMEFLKNKYGAVIRQDPPVVRQGERKFEEKERDYLRNDDGTIIVYNTVEEAEKQAKIFRLFNPKVYRLYNGEISEIHNEVLINA